MGMNIDKARAAKCLYAIDCGMKIKEAAKYSGYGERTVREIMKDPDKYREAIKESDDYMDIEYPATYAEKFMMDWEEVTGRIKDYFKKARTGKCRNLV